MQLLQLGVQCSNTDRLCHDIWNEN